MLQPTNPVAPLEATPDLVPNRFVLYENKRRFYIVCSDSAELRHRILRIERTTGKELEVFEDNVIYSSKELADMLKMLEDGNRSSGGLQKSQPFFGIAGAFRIRPPPGKPNTCFAQASSSSRQDGTW